VAKKKKNDKSVYLYIVDLFSPSFKVLGKNKINLFEGRELQTD